MKMICFVIIENQKFYCLTKNLVYEKMLLFDDVCCPFYGDDMGVFGIERFEWRV